MLLEASAEQLEDRFDETAAAVALLDFAVARSAEQLEDRFDETAAAVALLNVMGVQRNNSQQFH